MKKLLIVLFLLGTAAFGDTLAIVNKGTALPKIIIKDKSSLGDKNLQKNFYNLILNDLKVSSNFEVLESGDEKGNYVFEYTLSKNGSALSLNVIVKADSAIKSSRNYGLNNLEQYPFLAHKGVKGSVKDYRTSSAGRAGKPPVINTKEGKELTDGIHKMWQSITGNRNN